MVRLEVTTHSGDLDVVEVESYNAQELADKLNDAEILSVALGDNVYARIDVKNVKPVGEE